MDKKIARYILFAGLGLVGAGLLFALIQSIRLSSLKDNQRIFVESLESKRQAFELGPLARFQQREKTAAYRDLVRDVAEMYPELILDQNEDLLQAISDAKSLNDLLHESNPLQYADVIYARQKSIRLHVDKNTKAVAEAEKMYGNFEPYATLPEVFIERLDRELHDMQFFKDSSVQVMSNFMIRYPEHRLGMVRDTSTMYNAERGLRKNVGMAKTELRKDSLRDYHLIDEVCKHISINVAKYRNEFEKAKNHHRELDQCFQKTVIGTTASFDARFKIVTCYETGGQEEASHYLHDMTISRAKEVAYTRGRLLNDSEISKFLLPSPGRGDRWFDKNSYYVSSLEPRFQVHYLYVSNTGADRIETATVTATDFKKFNGNIGKSVAFKPKGEYVEHTTTNVLRYTRGLSGLDALQNIVEARSNTGPSYRGSENYDYSSLAFSTSVSVPYCSESYAHKEYVREQERIAAEKRAREERERKEREEREREREEERQRAAQRSSDNNDGYSGGYSSGGSSGYSSGSSSSGSSSGSSYSGSSSSSGSSGGSFNTGNPDN